jgi:hypothetical protein
MNRHTPYGTPARKGGAAKWAILLGLLLALIVASCASMFLVPFMLRQRSFDARLEWLDLTLAVAWRLVPLAAVVMGLRIAWRRLGWRESITAAHHIEYARASRLP